MNNDAQVAPRHRPSRPAHSVRQMPTWRLTALAAGICATVAAVTVGGAALVRAPAPARWTGPTARSITVSRPATELPLSNPQIIGLLSTGPNYGPLADSDQRRSCLSGLGYSTATKVLGAQPVDMDGRAAVLMVLPADTPRMVLALVVESDCNAAHTGLLANTLVARP